MTHEYAGIAANMVIKTVDNCVFDSYEACRQFAMHHGSQGDTEWEIASNVRLRLSRSPDGSYHYAIVLYRTEIVRYYADNQTFSVDNGGFNTPTTASRVTQFTPAGYSGWHHEKKLVLNGRPTGHDQRFPLTYVNYQEDK